MSTKSILGIILALGIPLACYWWLKSASDSAVDMPRRYLLDTVVSKIEKGKAVDDSIWHKTANITLQNQLGDTVSLYDKEGKILVLDFFFTSCRSICPRMTRNMRSLQASFKTGGNVRNKVDTAVIQFVSFTVDPERDSAQVLKAYADRFGVNHDNWWMLTGDKKKIYDFAFNELKVDKFSEEPISPDFVHTSRFVLLDRHKVVRGYYNGLDSMAMKKLARDVGLLLLEKGKGEKSGLFQKIANLSWLWFVIVLAVSFFVIYLRGRAKGGA
ncbi:MAG: SCO family protein [Sphingobacteriia bacterium]|nr:MAG: SCO family protein [Sphingobacteriia bacterium]